MKDGSETDQGTASWHELLEICRERQESAEQRQAAHTVTFLGRERTVNELWANVVDGISKLKPAGDAASSAHPTAGLVWGIIKVLLAFAVQGEKGSKEALTGISIAVNAIQRASVYESHIQEIAESETSQAHPHLAAFEACLTTTYERIFKFFYAAATCLGRSKPGLYWYVFWDGDDILNFEKDILHYEQSLFQDAHDSQMIIQNTIISQMHELLREQHLQASAQRRSLEELRKERREETGDQKARSSEILSLISAFGERLRENKKLEVEHSLNVDREVMLKWISDAKVEDHHHDAGRRRTKNTAKWILKQEIVRVLYNRTRGLEDARRIRNLSEATGKTWRLGGNQDHGTNCVDSIEVNGCALVKWLILRLIRGNDQGYLDICDGEISDSYDEDSDDGRNGDENENAKNDHTNNDSAVAQGIRRRLWEHDRDRVGPCLVRAFGFASSKNIDIMAKGFVALLERMGNQIQGEIGEIMRDWTLFLDLAAICEDEDEFYLMHLAQLQRGGYLAEEPLDEEFTGLYSD
ncbi:hypothetical protein FSARC_8369 [Fusarium sarcochroum]|uniref:Uncharacterized protein n=1 Tax=Fusarium sarcochroum TaxID=1208366 RepID=A0A8H4X708_9HYPO|nr:hypothetical protein FSARC_8369 [Fusarium sarcochroum]